MSVAYTTHNRMLTVALKGDIDHHRVKGLIRDLEREIDEVLPRQLIKTLSIRHISVLIHQAFFP